MRKEPSGRISLCLFATTVLPFVYKELVGLRISDFSSAPKSNHYKLFNTLFSINPSTEMPAIMKSRYDPGIRGPQCTVQKSRYDPGIRGPQCTVQKSRYDPGIRGPQCTVQKCRYDPGIRGPQCTVQ
jgi:hypothetical protein